jgi:L-ribulokinase
MVRRKYLIGVEFGTESAQAVLVDVSDGNVLARAVHRCANSVMDERLPGEESRAGCDPSRGP